MSSRMTRHTPWAARVSPGAPEVGHVSHEQKFLKFLNYLCRMTGKHSKSYHAVYSLVGVHLTQGDAQCPLQVDQPRGPLAWIQIVSISPSLGTPTSTSAGTLCSPCSHKISVRRGWRILRGPCDPHRCPSTQPSCIRCSSTTLYSTHHNSPDSSIAHQD
jgi:hypothetical protein